MKLVPNLAVAVYARFIIEQIVIIGGDRKNRDIAVAANLVTDKI